MSISAINNSLIYKNEKLLDVNKSVQKDAVSFQNLLVENLKKVSDYQLQSEKMDELFAIGEVDSIHDVTIASMKADLTLNLAVEVTNKVLSAYNEIMRLQL